MLGRKDAGLRGSLGSMMATAPPLSNATSHVDTPISEARATAAQSSTVDSPRSILSYALHVLSTEAVALAHTVHLYATSVPARRALLAAVRAVTDAHARGGKVVVCGIGKSGHVGRKLVATFQSLGLGAGFLHAAEAVHGDLGVIRETDVLLLISFSGRTRELLNVLSHVVAEVPVIALTGYVDASKCPLLKGRRVAGSGGERGGGEAEGSGGTEGGRGQDGKSRDGRGVGVLLPAPIHEGEEKSFGVGAPTTSSTVAMAVGDMLAMAAAESIHGTGKTDIFRRNHPGGAAGAEAVAGAMAQAGTASAAAAEP